MPPWRVYLSADVSALARGLQHRVPEVALQLLFADADGTLLAGRHPVALQPPRVYERVDLAVGEPENLRHFLDQIESHDREPSKVSGASMPLGAFLLHRCGAVAHRLRRRQHGFRLD